jgi:HlyD family secretion protein
MSATVEIQTENANDVLIIPIGAVTTRADTTDSKKEKKKSAEEADKDKKKDFIEVVFIFEDGIARMQQVEIGIQDNTNIQIKKGLEVGQEVVTGPYSLISKTLKEGDELKKVDREDLFKDD